MTNSIISFIRRFILFMLPVILLLIFWFVFDPFSMWHNAFSFAKRSESTCDNRLDITIYKRCQKSNHFNAFIMGNSKTMSFLAADWKTHIGAENRVFNYGSPGESLLNILEKLRDIEEHKDSVKYLLLVIDSKLIHNTDNSDPDYAGPVYLKTPYHSKNNWVAYAGKGYYYFLKDFYFADYMAWLAKGGNNSADMNEADCSNEELRADMEAKINTDTNAWKTHMGNSPVISRNPADTGISQTDRKYIAQIRDILTRQKTRTKILILPEYKREGVSEKLLENIRMVFGESAEVYDYSNKSLYISNPLNYYDPAHCRPFVGRMILEEVYKD